MSPVHWLVVLVVALLLFGPARLAGVGKGLGEGIRSFKKGLSTDEDPPDDEQPKKQLAKGKKSKAKDDSDDSDA